MLVSLQTRRPHGAPDGAIDLLLACHTRIRSFCGIAHRLAYAFEADLAEIADTARSVHRYFTSAFPLHVEDEDLSLIPRLERVANHGILGALERMAEQHDVIDPLVRHLVPAWRTLSEEPNQYYDLAVDIARDTGRLEGLLHDHLLVEEMVVFPTARAILSTRELAEIAREMRMRRAA